MTHSPPTSTGPDVLGVLLTAKCNISCRHCCNDSHPSHAGAVRFEEIARLIEGARDIPSIREIGLSGGEPFLFIPLVRRVVEFAAGLGFTSSVTTNGFWARWPHAARLLQELGASGLRAIHISTSAFHQEFIPLEAVGRAAEAGLLAGLKVTINVVSTRERRGRAIRAGLARLDGRVRFVTMPCLPAGRGEAGIRDEEFAHDQEAPRGNCREHFRKLAVDREGNVYPCCSPGGFTPPLRMGNVREDSLRSIVDASADSKLLAILESVGPQFFLPFLRAEGVDPSLPERFSDQCHLCHVMLSSERYAETIRAASERLFSGLAALPAAEGALEGERLMRVVRRMQQGRTSRPMGGDQCGEGHSHAGAAQA